MVGGGNVLRWTETAVGDETANGSGTVTVPAPVVSRSIHPRSGTVRPMVESIVGSGHIRPGSNHPAGVVIVDLVSEVTTTIIVARLRVRLPRGNLPRCLRRHLRHTVAVDEEITSEVEEEVGVVGAGTTTVTIRRRLRRHSSRKDAGEEGVVTGTRTIAVEVGMTLGSLRELGGDSKERNVGSMAVDEEEEGIPLLRSRSQGSAMTIMEGKLLEITKIYL